MGFNITSHLGGIRAGINNLQARTANIFDGFKFAVLGDASAPSQSQLRQLLTVNNASLALQRQNESIWVQGMQEDLKANKALIGLSTLAVV